MLCDISKKRKDYKIALFFYEKISTGTARYDLDPIRSSKVRIQRHLKAFYIVFILLKS
jgi:hypothetical protein